VDLLLIKVESPTQKTIWERFMFKQVKLHVSVIGALLLIAAVTVNASAVLVTVTAEEPDGWFGMDQAGAATGALTTTQPYPSGGTGSLEFTTSGDQADIINAARIPLIRFNEITSVAYDFYSSDGTVAPALKIQYWNPTRFGTLVYEPYVSANPAYSIDTWTYANASAGTWWSTEFGQTDLRLFADWITEIGDVPVTFLQTGVGSGWSTAMTGHVDMVTLGVNGNATTWDFEGEAPLPPQPEVPSRSVPTLSQWALILMALMIGGLAFRSRKRIS
jgi:hypothetical protein